MGEKNVFVVEDPDYDLSPYTGMTRRHFVDAGIYLLKGLFENLGSIDDAPLVPRTETEVTYPHLGASPEQIETERKAEIFEGLTRTFFIGSVLIHDDPELVIGGIKLRDYYKLHILRALSDKTSREYIGTFEELKELVGKDDPTRCYQQTVETCALVIGLWACRDEIWDTYTKEEKDKIALFLKGYAHAATVPQNWRLFNMLDMAFLHMEGYEIDEHVMREHAQAILHYYAGDGWYRDGQSFDYYSCWAFNMYAPIWNVWYGYENEPYLAGKFEEASNELMKTYPDFFDGDGYTMMFGRSCIYRFAATSAFDGNFLLKNSVMDPGRARRITAGSILQFLERDDFLENMVPSLGFYRRFMPLVQGYSCAESVYWLGKAFLCLHLPKDHPFWTEKENNGDWGNDSFYLKNHPKAKEEDKYIKHINTEVKKVSLDGPAISISNHKANRATVIRTGKVVKNTGDEHGMWNYSKISFNSKYPWEGGLIDPESGERIKDIESMQYVLYDEIADEYQKANVTFWHGEKDNVLYRRQYFNYRLSDETHWINAVNLADIPVSYGILRFDKLRLFRPKMKITLGSYGFPDNGKTTVEKKEKNGAKAIILKGYDSQGREKQLAMTVFFGFSSIDVVKSKGSNPDSDNSMIIYGTYNKNNLYDSSEDYMLISQVITKENHEDFSDEELFCIKKLEFTDADKTGAYGDINVTLSPGVSAVKTYRINFEQIEGKLML